MYRRYQNRASWRGPEAALRCAMAAMLSAAVQRGKAFPPLPIAVRPVAARSIGWVSAICFAPAERIWCRRQNLKRCGICVSDIFREIEEELRRDNLLKLWQRYAKYIIGGVVLVLVIAGLVVAWRQYATS